MTNFKIVCSMFALAVLFGFASADDSAAATLNCTRDNEVYKACGTVCGSTCRTRNVLCPKVKCIPNCFCKEGYFRNDDEICVPKSECDKETCKGPNEIYLTCGPICATTCFTRNLRCSAVGCAKAGCYCADGFKRSNENICIPTSDCDKEVTCEGANEVFMSCGPYCEPTCATLGQPCNRRYITCPRGCFCQKGFARNADNFCIPKKECKKCKQE